MLAFALSALATQPVFATVPGIDVSPFEALSVSPEIHLLTTPLEYAGPAIGNISIIEQGDGFIVVDSGLTAGNGRTVVDYIRARSSKPAKAVVITHWHNDHPQGVSEILAAWPGARIIATKATRQAMLTAAVGPMVGLEASAAREAEMRKTVDENIARLDAQISDPALPEDRRERAKRARHGFELFARDYPGTRIVPPTETFDRSLLLDDERVPVQLLFLGRANTSGDAVVWLPRQKIVITGDVIVAPTPYGFFSYPGEWVQTLQRLKALNFSTLIPGHGEPQFDSQYIDRVIGSIEDIRAQVGPPAISGMSLEDVRKRVDFSRYAEIFGTDERRRRLFKAYWVDPMTENAWKEAKGLPIVQGEGETTVAKQSQSAREK